MDPAPGREPESLAGARIRWRAAEERLYPLALADSDAYMDAVEAVGRVLTELRTTCTSNADLIRAETDHALMDLVGTGSRGGTPPDPATVIAAACALRSVELGAQALGEDGGTK
jgi:hypothetical protein